MRKARKCGNFANLRIVALLLAGKLDFQKLNQQAASPTRFSIGARPTACAPSRGFSRLFHSLKTP
jgi:hypothetical protein